MARDNGIEERLVRWASSVTVGDGTGFPTMSVLHPEWQPPSPGVTPTMKTAPGSDVQQTHRAIGQLSMRLRNTVVVHYCIKGSLEEQALRLDCEVVTVHARINQAHRELQALLAE
jgi:DNA-directed RNA polymerase specialized sigma24 family protein